MAFKKGQSGNPGGRGKERPFADALRLELTAVGEDHKALRNIARKLIAKAEDGDMNAIVAIADRLDGKPAQEANITNETTVRYVARVPEKKPTSEAWQTSHTPETMRH